MPTSEEILANTLPSRSPEEEARTRLNEHLRKVLEGMFQENLFGGNSFGAVGSPKEDAAKTLAGVRASQGETSLLPKRTVLEQLLGSRPAQEVSKVSKALLGVPAVNRGALLEASTPIGGPPLGKQLSSEEFIKLYQELEKAAQRIGGREVEHALTAGTEEATKHIQAGGWTSPEDILLPSIAKMKETVDALRQLRTVPNAEITIGVEGGKIAPEVGELGLPVVRPGATPDAPVEALPSSLGKAVERGVKREKQVTSATWPWVDRAVLRGLGAKAIAKLFNVPHPERGVIPKEVNIAQWARTKEALEPLKAPATAEYDAIKNLTGSLTPASRLTIYAEQGKIAPEQVEDALREVLFSRTRKEGAVLGALKDLAEVKGIKPEVVENAFRQSAPYKYLIEDHSLARLANKAGKGRNFRKFVAEMEDIRKRVWERLELPEFSPKNVPRL